MSTLVLLEEAADRARFGGKAAGLYGAIRAGFDVPHGFALSVSLVERLVRGDAEARERCAWVFGAVGGSRVAARSSAVGEDAADASFAGQHLTVLGLATADALVDAVVRIHASGHDPAALAYRARMGVNGSPKVAVVVQRMVDADCAGVLFTQNPVTGADERVVEAAWGLGEAVVGGLVEPDRWRMRRGGEIVERSVGEKDVAIRPSGNGGTEEVPIDETRRMVPCLHDAELRRLDDLARRCEVHFPGVHDVEWAFADDTLYLLQRRAATR